MRELKAGIWRHYKGHLYLVLGYANDANQEDRTVVVYVGLELAGAKHGERINVRTVEDFFATVHPGTGATISYWDGTAPPPVYRFTYVGPSVPGEMMAGHG
jgi:hypothetical protein